MSNVIYGQDATSKAWYTYSTTGQTWTICCTWNCPVLVGVEVVGVEVDAPLIASSLERELWELAQASLIHRLTLT